MISSQMRNALLGAFGKPETPESEKLTQKQGRLFEFITSPINIENIIEPAQGNEGRELELYINAMCNYADHLGLSDADVLKVYSSIIHKQVEESLMEEHKWKD